MDNAFNPGDPALEVAGVVSGKHQYRHEEHWVVRDEQNRIDDIVHGRKVGHYYLIVGEKGTGKTSMLLEAMRKINGVGCAMFEAHADLEIFRIRLGKALDYEFHEEYGFSPSQTRVISNDTDKRTQLYRQSFQYPWSTRYHCLAGYRKGLQQAGESRLRQKKQGYAAAGPHYQ